MAEALTYLELLEIDPNVIEWLRERLYTQLGSMHCDFLQERLPAQFVIDRIYYIQKLTSGRITTQLLLDRTILKPLQMPDCPKPSFELFHGKYYSFVGKVTETVNGVVYYPTGLVALVAKGVPSDDLNKEDLLTITWLDPFNRAMTKIVPASQVCFSEITQDTWNRLADLIQSCK